MVKCETYFTLFKMLQSCSPIHYIIRRSIAARGTIFDLDFHGISWLGIGSLNTRIYVTGTLFDWNQQLLIPLGERNSSDEILEKRRTKWQLSETTSCSSHVMSSGKRRDWGIYFQVNLRSANFCQVAVNVHKRNQPRHWIDDWEKQKIKHLFITGNLTNIKLNLDYLTWSNFLSIEFQQAGFAGAAPASSPETEEGADSNNG